jgi:hypothetical protein
MFAGLAALAPKAEAAGNGVQMGAFAYVYENDTWLTDMRDMDEPPAFVVLNIGNGATDDVGHLDTIAQGLRAEGIKVYGYVDTAGATRSTYDVALDSARWINPFNPERNNYSQMVDGIFLDQVPNTCGTSGANVLRVADYMSNINSQFSFWSYGTATVMANVGTAVNECMPGFQAYSDMPDKWVTFEGTYATYQSSYLGGNVTNGSTYYNGENTFGQDKFVHIVYDADQAEMQDAVRLADNRGAAYIYATDDVLSNPYDAAPTYQGASTRWAATPHMIFDDGWDGIEFGYTGTPSLPWVAQFKLRNTAGTGDSDMVTRFRNLVLQECYVDIFADNAYSGNVGSSVDTRGVDSGFEGWDISYTALDTNFVTCVKDAIQPGTNPNDPALYICNDIVGGFPSPTQVTDYDCRNPDGSSDTADENVNEDATSFLWGVLDNNATVQEFIVLIRDRYEEDGNAGTGGANCINTAGRRCLEPANPAPGGLGQWRWPSAIIIRPNHTPIQNITGFELGWSTSAGGGFPNP